MGCSSHSSSQVTEFFSTTIMEDDSKRFYFSLIISNQTEANKSEGQKQSQRSKGGVGKGSGSRKGRNSKSQTDQQPVQQPKVNKRVFELEERLINKLALNNYCRTGYMELERNIGKALMSIRGECHESATEEDRQHFINRLSQAIKSLIKGKLYVRINSL